jgi:hypothetical protein
LGSGSTSSESFCYKGVASGSTSQKLPMIKETHECRECGSSCVAEKWPQRQRLPAVSL